MSGLRRVGKLRKGMRVSYDGRKATVWGFPTRNTVSLLMDGDKEPIKVDISEYWIWQRNVI